MMCLAASISCPLQANQTPMLPESPLVSSPAANDKYFIAYQSKRLPQWDFNVRMDRTDRAEQYHPTGTSNDLVGIQALSVSARRALPVSSPQWIYATFRSSQYSVTPEASSLPIAADSATAASIGWQFGEQEGFGLAVGYEYTDMGEVDINSVVMGVRYYF